jgi:hypothetical protein
MTSRTATIEDKQQFLDTYLHTRFRLQVEREMIDTWEDGEAEVRLQHPDNVDQDQIKGAVNSAVDSLTARGFKVVVKEKKHRTILKVS